MVFSSEPRNYSWHFFLILLRVFWICGYFNNAFIWFVILTVKNYVENNNNKNKNEEEQNLKPYILNNIMSNQTQKEMLRD